VYYFLSDQDVATCTATVVALNVLLTAAHCVALERQAIGAAFCPSQWGPEMPFGCWPVDYSVYYSEYFDLQLTPLDYAFTVVTRNSDGDHVGSVVGNYGFVVNYVHDMWAVGYACNGLFKQWCFGETAYAYSTWAPFTGYGARLVDGQTFYDIGIGSALNKGSSGGPWFTYYDDGSGYSWNYIASVTSHGDGYEEPTGRNNWGPYFTNDTLALYNSLFQ
jgi:hypothetical protein